MSTESNDQVIEEVCKTCNKPQTECSCEDNISCDDCSEDSGGIELDQCVCGGSYCQNCLDSNHSECDELDQSGR